MNIKTLTLGDIDFPASLALIPQPPKQLYVLGAPLNLLLERPAISIVGSRKVSPYGRSVSLTLARELATQGITIISGLALGVDSLAHQAALEVGGLTIAVLPCGLDAIYPASHTQLAKEILQHGGTLVSEYPAGTPPLKPHFIARNRLVAGLGLGVLVTEAAEKSGTLHTANFALEQGKAVFAVPGNITSQLSKGTNNLIKSGALPITDSDDILNALNLETIASNNQPGPAMNAQEAVLIRLLQQGVSDASELQLLSKLPPAIFNQTLTMLEITGRIRPLGANHWSL